MKDYESPDQIEREIDQTRAEISHTITALQQKLSPGTLLDQALASVKGGGGDFVGNLGRTIRDNPMPVLLTGAGLTWLMLSEREGGRHTPAVRRIPREDPHRVPLSPGADTTTASASGTMRGAADTAKGAAESGRAAADTARAKVEGLADQAKSQARHAGEKLQQTGEKLKESAADLRARAQRASESVKERASVAYRRTTDTAYRTGSRVGDAVGSVGGFIREYPIVVGALAVALGAGLAMLVPSTRREDELMGETSDALKAAAKEKVTEVKETVAEQVDKAGVVASAAASAAIDTARKEAERQNLVPGDSTPDATPSASQTDEKSSTGSPSGTATDAAPGTASVFMPGSTAAETGELPKSGSEPGDVPAIPGYTRDEMGGDKKV